MENELNFLKELRNTIEPDLDDIIMELLK